MPDSIRYGRIRQETRYNEAGVERAEVVVPIFINDHGPFVERFTLEDWTNPVTVQTRVNALRDQLARLPQA